ncbi:glycosyltransferase family 2 protein [Thelephora ganbajun]|uniref:Glycosyltransferase family 2 protein n=1 Tax=Thelephora ganbajun TaxID=370292 RepID=A0ACB6ZQL3_THEGA|nr:glycosyltransferase family 2 protein [Thelephora ganbajun]
MDHHGRRPPRSARPNQQQPLPPPPSHSEPSLRPAYGRHESHQGYVSFQNTERGARNGPIDHPRHPGHSPYNNHTLSTTSDPTLAETGGYSGVGRKKSLVRPEREKIEPGHRQWHYRSHAAGESNASPGVNVLPSITGNQPAQLRRGRSILARDEDVHESGLALFKRGPVRRKSSTGGSRVNPEPPKKDRSCLDSIGPGPKNWWFLYCFAITCCVPPALLRACGIRTPEQQRAWREKIGLISIILSLMAGVGFLTFGFTLAVCSKPPTRFHSGEIQPASVVIHGFDYDFSTFNHPAVGTWTGRQNPLFEGGWNAAGNDISFLFQKVNQRCRNLITKAPNSTITGNNGDLNWYFPCNIYNQRGNSGVNLTRVEAGTNCHHTSRSRTMLAAMKRQGEVYYTWDDVRDPSRNLAVFESAVLDLNLLNWLTTAQVRYPPVFDALKRPNGTFNGKDLSMYFYRTNQRTLAQCLEDVVTVGFIDTKSVGCVASDVVLYLSLIFIIGVVAIRFVMAVMFAWCFSWKLGVFKNETFQERNRRIEEIENWTSDIYRPAPNAYRPDVTKKGLAKQHKAGGFLPTQSRFTPSDNLLKGARPTTAYYGKLDSTPHKRGNPTSIYGSVGGKGSKSVISPDLSSRSSTSLPDRAGFLDICPFPIVNVVPQPSPDYEPFGFPPAHMICLVTAYSESEAGLRTTLDSIATTDYPNSHKLILVIADGQVIGDGNSLPTPKICLTMMKELVVPVDQVDSNAYVAIADGEKQLNEAKVYAGFYHYDDNSVEKSKQQRVPIVLVEKVGNRAEQENHEKKAGNRGKRDSQIILMSFLQKVMFDERMTTFEYEFFNSIWRVTGISPDRYELALCVDADTKVFPDALSRMAACMVDDPEIMGLCGETKIANKAESWVTMIQVFEYYTSHHMVKAFESMFGGVTCLPGCFSMYRIKAPKGDTGYWVPILANPDIVEHYSENIVDTLHKKNLLLLGEDRYLTTLMLKTFPKRKNVFCPQAVCKTVVPERFSVLLSQRRRWINSTIHNLAELILVRDLCGTFCFSMQFVVGMELAGTLVLPAAISFTVYLIIVSIIPGGTNTTIPLVLLGIILGLPGLLIVITTRKLSYVGWMLIYLLSLPVWNGILPTYAFWHFDDFSWGQTRMTQGETTRDADHGDKRGEFDSSGIVMKRWVEFERERRWKSGTPSARNSYYDPRSSSPKRNADSRRQSLVSTTERDSRGYDATTLESSNYTQGSGSRSRHDSQQLLMLPAPLSVNRSSLSPMSVSRLSRTSEDAGGPDSSRQRLISSPQSVDDRYGYDTPEQSPSMPTSSRYTNPQRVVSEYDRVPSSADPEEYPPGNYTPSPSSQSQTHRTRGVSLMDRGPVPGPDGVRRVAMRRQSQQSPPQNRYSRGSTYLPPGAAMPQPGGHGNAH